MFMTKNLDTLTTIFFFAQKTTRDVFQQNLLIEKMTKLRNKSLQSHWIQKYISILFGIKYQSLINLLKINIIYQYLTLDYF